MMTFAYKQFPKLSRRWFRFSLRNLLILVALVAVVLAVYEPLTLHFKAAHFFNMKNIMSTTREHPDDLFYHIEGRDDAVVCYFAEVRIVLLGRKHDGGTSGLVRVAGAKPEQGGNRSVEGKLYFSYSYADGEAECQVHGFPFLCRAETVEINGQTFDKDVPIVILVDTDDQILKTYTH